MKLKWIGLNPKHWDFGPIVLLEFDQGGFGRKVTDRTEWFGLGPVWCRR